MASECDTSRNPLDLLIGPLDRSEFLSQYWGKQYLIAGEGDAGRFASLFSWDALSEILSTQRFDFPRLRLLSGGRVAPPAQYIVQKVDRRGNPYATHDSAAVRRMLDAGAMLHITSLGETWAPLAAFAAKLEGVLGGKVQVNLHAGYAGSRGFHTHWDGHDVYAAQIDGSKRWRLFGFTEPAPLAVPPDEKWGAPSRASWEGVLHTGQMLYLPRGYWHATQFTDDPSLHLTFAVQHPTGVDFAHWIAARLANETAARRDLPLARFDAACSDDSLREAYAAEMRELVGRSMSVNALDDFLADYRATLGGTNHVRLAPTERTPSCETA
jgi:ribosomal protein L16 Arg81 hydroxylase